MGSMGLQTHKTKVQSWQETLSGGEKQRLAMARLLYHRPLFAVLDECTSAVSADGQVKLYQELQRAGITCLSIAHRPALRRFHSQIVHFDGSVSKNGLGWWVEDLDQQEGSSTAASTPSRPGAKPPSLGGGSFSAATGSVPQSPSAMAGSLYAKENGHAKLPGALLACVYRSLQHYYEAVSICVSDGRYSYS